MLFKGSLGAKPASRLLFWTNQTPKTFGEAGEQGDREGEVGGGGGRGRWEGGAARPAWQWGFGLETPQG